MSPAGSRMAEVIMWSLVWGFCGPKNRGPKKQTGASVSFVGDDDEISYSGPRRMPLEVFYEIFPHERPKAKPKAKPVAVDLDDETLESMAATDAWHAECERANAIVKSPEWQEHLQLSLADVEVYDRQDTEAQAAVADGIRQWLKANNHFDVTVEHRQGAIWIGTLFGFQAIEIRLKWEELARKVGGFVLACEAR